MTSTLHPGGTAGLWPWACACPAGLMLSVASGPAARSAGLRGLGCSGATQGSPCEPGVEPGPPDTFSISEAASDALGMASVVPRVIHSQGGAGGGPDLADPRQVVHQRPHTGCLGRAAGSA